MKEGIVLLLGRPNVGKSTFVNNIIGQKVAITSPKPQTTRFPIQGLYESERGKIIFTDTPGIFGRAEDPLSKKINAATINSIYKECDVALYFIDPTRKRNFEEAKVLGIVRKIKAPVVLVMNKSDQKQTYLPHYMFLEDEFPKIFHISAIKSHGFDALLDYIFELLPEKTHESIADIEHVYPLLNMDSKTFIAELIREKIFIMMGEEIPYTATVVVSEITQRKNGMMYIKAKILTTNDRYKKMLIGAGGCKIKELGSYARKEIALAINKNVYLDLMVEVDADWQSSLYA